MQFAVRKNSAFRGHPVVVLEHLVTPRKQKPSRAKVARCYMIAGATAGELIVRENQLIGVDFYVWLILLAWMGWRQQKRSVSGSGLLFVA